jgi:hypothetical protein
MLIRTILSAAIVNVRAYAQKKDIINNFLTQRIRK